MKLELLVSDMMRMNVLARLWHWTTDTATHHTSYEQFLTQNETLTDSLVESALGNDRIINFAEVGVVEAISKSYSLQEARSELMRYRNEVFKHKQSLSSDESPGGEELVTILDDVTELASKTLYLLKLK